MTLACVLVLIVWPFVARPGVSVLHYTKVYTFKLLLTEDRSTVHSIEVSSLDLQKFYWTRDKSKLDLYTAPLTGERDWKRERERNGETHIVDDKDAGNEFAQIRIRLSLVRVRESNSFTCCPNKLNIVHQTREQKKCFTMFDRMFERNQTSWNIVQHRKTWWPNV